MSTTTPLLGLVKPDQGENQDVDVLNANLDKIEQGVKGKLTLPYAIMRKTDGFSPSYSNNVQDTLGGWNGNSTEYIDLLSSSGSGMSFPYNAGVFTIPVNGIYNVEASVTWLAQGDSFDAVGSRRLSIYQSRSAGWVEIVRDQRPGQASLSVRNYASKMAHLNAGDFIKFDVAQSSGAIRTLDASLGGTYFWANLVCLIRLD